MPRHDPPWMSAILPGIVLSALLFGILSCVGCMLPDGWQNQIPDGDDGTVTPDPTTTTTTQPPAPPVVPPPVVPTPPVSDYTITRWDSNNVWWTGPDFGWGPNDGNTYGEAHLYRANGKGGKFDHVRNDTKWRDFKNIPSYGVWPSTGEPENGENVTLRACNYAKTEWVTIGTFQWRR